MLQRHITVYWVFIAEIMRNRGVCFPSMERYRHISVTICVKPNGSLRHSAEFPVNTGGKCKRTPVNFSKILYILLIAQITGIFAFTSAVRRLDVQDAGRGSFPPGRLGRLAPDCGPGRSPARPVRAASYLDHAAAGLRNPAGPFFGCGCSFDPEPRPFGYLGGPAASFRFPPRHKHSEVRRQCCRYSDPVSRNYCLDQIQFLG